MHVIRLECDCVEEAEGGESNEVCCAFCLAEARRSISRTVLTAFFSAITWRFSGGGHLQCCYLRNNIGWNSAKKCSNHISFTRRLPKMWFCGSDIIFALRTAAVSGVVKARVCSPAVLIYSFYFFCLCVYLIICLVNHSFRRQLSVRSGEVRK